MSITDLIRADTGAVDALARRLRRYEAGVEALDGLTTYLDLEAATSLRDLHLVLRPGERNRVRSGLQQSYGDHNRLLLFGLDRLLAGDVDWLASRVSPSELVLRSDLERCAATVARADLSRPARAALWVGAALHDCGMLGGSPPGVDVEDGVAIAAPLTERLCAPEMRPLAAFAVRNHDYVKDHELGEVPTGFLAAQLDRLDASLRPAALLALGMVQVAGAASLGDGRLTRFRLRIFERCASGDLVADPSPASRLGRLLAPSDELDQWAQEGGPEARVDTISAGPKVLDLLERVPLHRWHRSWSGLPQGDRIERLEAVAAAWDGAPTDHVVHQSATADPADAEVIRLANGTTALVLV